MVNMLSSFSIQLISFVFIYFSVSSLLSSKEENIKKLVNIRRWYKLIESQAAVVSVMKNLPNDVKLTSHSSQSNSGTATAASSGGGKFVDLPDAEEGKVVVRFPPEASG